jgi:hypothetical protein
MVRVPMAVLLGPAGVWHEKKGENENDGARCIEASYGG